MQKYLPIAAAMLMCFACAHESAAQPPVAPRTAPAVNAAPREYRVKQVLGTKVSLQGNLEIGTVDDIVFGDDGVVEYLIVLNRGRLVTVPWEAAKFNFEHRTTTLTITHEQFKLIPTYTVEEYPTFYAPAYRLQIYKYYGLTPRELRRIERK